MGTTHNGTTIAREKCAVSSFMVVVWATITSSILGRSAKICASKTILLVCNNHCGGRGFSFNLRFADACEQPKEEGPCRGSYPRWYYDKDTSTCYPFTYGGCKGNNNNFLSESACKQKCAQPGRQKGKI